jgi:hypothetical protein
MESLSQLKNYFKMSAWQYVVILGIAISGLATFINTYNAFSRINENLEGCIHACPQSLEIYQSLQTQFIIILILSIVAILFGILLFWLLRKAENQRRIITLGIITAGIFGIFYAISIRFNSLATGFKVAISWAAFIAFLILGFLIGKGKSVQISWASKK